MRKLITTTLVMMIAASLYAQDNRPGNVLNIGIGGGKYNHGYYGYYNKYYKGYNGWPVFSVSFDHAMKKAGPGIITLGGAVAVGKWYYDYPGTPYSANWSSWTAGARVSWYPDITAGKDWDAYVSLHLGFGYATYRDDYYVKNGNPFPGYGYYKNDHVFGYGAFLIGGHYYFSPAFGVFAEVGADIAPAKLGLSVKF